MEYVRHCCFYYYFMNNLNLVKENSIDKERKWGTRQNNGLMLIWINGGRV